MPIVRMPDGVLVNMPDDPTQEQIDQIKEALGQKSPESDSWEPLKEKVNTIGNFLGNTIKGVPEFTKEVDRAAKTGIRRGVTALPELARMLGGWVGIPGSVIPKPISEAYTNFRDSDAPKTKAGKVAANILESTTASVLPLGLAKAGANALMGAGAGVGSEAAGAMFDGNPVAKILGSLLGGGAGSISSKFIPSAARGSAKSSIASAGKDIPPEQWKDAREMANLLSREGIPFIPNQLLAQGSHKLDTLFENVMKTPEGQNRVQNHLAPVADKSREAINRWIGDELEQGKEVKAFTNMSVGESDNPLTKILKGLTGGNITANPAKYRSLSNSPSTRETLAKLQQTMVDKIADIKKEGTKLFGDIYNAKTVEQEDAIKFLMEGVARRREPIEEEFAKRIQLKHTLDAKREAALQTYRDATRQVPNSLANLQFDRGLEVSMPQPPYLPKGVFPSRELKQLEGLEEESNVLRQQLGAINQIPKKDIIDSMKQLIIYSNENPNTRKGELAKKLATDLQTNGEAITDPLQISGILRSFKSQRLGTDAFSSKDPVDVETAAALTKFIGSIRGKLKDSSPSFAAAEEAWLAHKIDKLIPLRKSLVGDIASIGGGPKSDRQVALTSMLDKVFPKNISQPELIRQLAQDIGTSEVGALLKEHLARTMENVFKIEKGANTISQPFKFVQALAGTGAQRENLKATIESIASAEGKDSKLVYEGFTKLLQAMETTKNLSGSPKLMTERGIAFPHGRPFGWPYWFAAEGLGAFTKMFNKKSHAEAAKIFTSPNGLDIMEKLATSKKPSTIRRLLNSFGTLGTTIDKEEE